MSWKCSKLYIIRDISHILNCWFETLRSKNPEKKRNRRSENVLLFSKNSFKNYRKDFCKNDSVECRFLENTWKWFIKSLVLVF